MNWRSLRASWSSASGLRTLRPQPGADRLPDGATRTRGRPFRTARRSPAGNPGSTQPPKPPPRRPVGTCGRQGDPSRAGAGLPETVGGMRPDHCRRSTLRSTYDPRRLPALDRRGLAGAVPAVRPGRVARVRGGRLAAHRRRPGPGAVGDGVPQGCGEGFRIAGPASPNRCPGRHQPAPKLVWAGGERAIRGLINLAVGQRDGLGLPPASGNARPRHGVELVPAKGTPEPRNGLARYGPPPFLRGVGPSNHGRGAGETRNPAGDHPLPGFCFTGERTGAPIKSSQQPSAGPVK